MTPTEFYELYSQKGFNFSRKILTRYCLSLYTKPFVLLSGISGTGKTKIAQLFQLPATPATPATPAAPSAPPPAAAPPPRGNFVILNVTSGLRDGDGRGNLRFTDLAAIFEQADLPAINQNIQALKARGGDDNITDPEIFTVDAGNGQQFQIGIYLQRASSPLLRVRAKSKRNETPDYDAQTFLRANYAVNDTVQLQKIGPRHLRVVSVNNQAVIQASQQIQQQQAAAVVNQLFIAVKSNWTDGSELWGFYNMLDEKYHCTPLLKFILTAHEYPERPFFLILDEMNLSKVEHYFSDFLSCLESRYMNGTDLVQEKVQLHHLDAGADSTDAYFDIIPARVEIPANLYVTGTVNIDETTYMFSPKVLDRANVIEFNAVDLDGYTPAADNTGIFSLQNFPGFGQTQLATPDAYRAAPAGFKAVVQELLDILQPYNLHFGYRVINEMALFIQNTRLFVGDTEAIIAEAIDIQLYQKVLPKFNGNFGKLNEPLRKLIVFASAGQLQYEDISTDTTILTDMDRTNAAYPETLDKLISMYTNLVHNGFTSYLE